MGILDKERAERAAFLAQRTKAVGGSDVHHLGSEEPYGCRRRLWYDKTGAEPDYPLQDAGVLRRGRIMEPVAAQEWRRHLELKGDPRSIRRQPQRVDRAVPYFACNIDYQILNDPRGPGPLSVKVPGERMFRKIRQEGLPAYYLLQLQWEMGILNASWGAFCVFWADGWELLTFEVARDDALIDGLRTAAHGFWREVENGPTPSALPADDRRCLSCPWSKTCQGVDYLTTDVTMEEERDDSLLELVRDYETAGVALDQADELRDLIGSRLRDAVGARAKLRVGPYRVTYAPSKPQPKLDVKELRLKRPRLYERIMRRFHVTPPPTRALRLYPPKGDT